MRDSIELAKRGVPAVILVPAGLVELAQEKADFLGLPDLPLAVLERSLYGRASAEIAADALALGETIRRALAIPPDA
ncbi:MAG: hypothetical protein U0556_19895 [Dehalococcoidia bacterium]